MLLISSKKNFWNHTVTSNDEIHNRAVSKPIYGANLGLSLTEVQTATILQRAKPDTDVEV